MPSNRESKRLRWAALIIGMMLAVCGPTVGYTMSVDRKLAETEKKRFAAEATNSLMFQTILKEVSEIKDELKDMRKEKP